MRLLLDTHVLLWAMQDSRSLSATARRYLRAADAVYVSAVSLWEIAVKASLGKLVVDMEELESRLGDAGFAQLAVGWNHAVQLRRLPLLHRDPFDRMLIAQAISEPLRLLTHDAALTAYSDLAVKV